MQLTRETRENMQKVNPPIYSAEIDDGGGTIRPAWEAGLPAGQSGALTANRSPRPDD